MKKQFLTLLALGLAVPALAFAHANNFGGGTAGCRMNGIFFRSASFILHSQTELGLTKEQIQAINDLKLDVGKKVNLQKAEIENSKLDIQSLLRTDKPDVAAIEKLIDQKSELAKTNEKTTVEAYVKLKGLLTDQQLQNLENIKKEHKQKACAGKQKQGSNSAEHTKTE